MKKPVHLKTVFTTGDVARLLCTAPRTVTKWVDSGELKGYRLPCSPDRRILRADLLEFLDRKGVPFPEGLGARAKPQLLLVSSRDGLAPRLRKYARERLTVVSEPYLFLAGMYAQQHCPEIILLDFACGRGECMEAARWYDGAEGARPTLLALMYDGLEALTLTGFDHAFPATVHPERIMEVCLEAIEPEEGER